MIIFVQEVRICLLLDVNVQIGVQCRVYGSDCAKETSESREMSRIPS